jgi:hypothetical protein
MFPNNIRAKLHFSLILIFSVASEGMASTLLDRQFMLETIGFIKPADNVDGIFDESIATSYRDYFSQHSRFVLNDLSKGDALLTRSKIPYHKLINDLEILRQLARTTRTESMIKTKVIKQQSKYQITLDWLHAPQMEQIATLQFDIEEPADGSPLTTRMISEVIHTQLDALVAMLPFEGTVTGRDHRSVTMNIGYRSHIKPGDTLLIGTLDEVKRHPILKKIVDWKLTPTGKVRIQQTDEGMAFGEVISEEEEHPISQAQKVIKVTSEPISLTPPIESPAEANPSKKGNIQLGKIGISTLLGNSSWQLNVPTSSVANNGGGLALGAKASVDVWLTKDWFSNLELGGAFWNFSQKNTSSGELTSSSQGGGVSGSLNTFKFGLGYSYLITKDPQGPRGWATIGYKTHSFSLPSSTEEYTGNVSFKAVFLGVGAETPILGSWGAFADLNFKLLGSVNQKIISNSSTGYSNFEFLLGGSYQLKPGLSLRAGLNFFVSGADFSNGESLRQKMITFTPSVLYYF